MDKQSRNIWWGPPRSINEAVNERKISWLELFYDLVYVAVIAQLTGYLASNFSWESAGLVFFIFSLVFWSWLNGSNYHDLHGSTGIRTRFITLFQMFAIAAVAITLNDLFDGNHIPFATAFAIVQALITYLWYSVGYYDPSHKILNKYFSIFYSLSFILLIVSIFTNIQIAYYLWAIVVILNFSAVVFAGPVTVRELKARGLVSTTSKSIIERIGLFTIIVLGENILGVVHGIGHISDKSPQVWMVFLLGILIVFLIWWIYFDVLGESEAKPGYGNFLIFNTLNLPLLGAMAISGSALRVITEEIAHPEHHSAIWIFGFALAVILTCIVCITSIMVFEEVEKPVMKKLNGLIALAIVGIIITTILNNYLSTILFMIIIAAILLITVFTGTKMWVQFKMFESKKLE